MSDRKAEAYGQHGVTLVDRVGVWLSQRAIRRALPARQGLAVLELGCGYRAAQLVALHDRIGRACAIDFRVAPEVAARPGFEVQEGDIEVMLPRLAGRTFDAVLLISVLEHLSSPEAVLAALHPMLRPSGVLLVNVPTWRGKTWLEFSAFRLGLSPRVEMDDHKMYYDKRDLWPLLVRVGFRPSAIRLRYHKFGLNVFAVARK